MSVIRVNKTKDFTVMSNHHLRNKNLSLKAKGLLSLMFSLPDNWNYSIAGLCSICKENETAIKSTIKELKQYEYIFVDKLLPDESDSKRLEYIYNIYENPDTCRKYKKKRQKEREERKKRKNQEVGFLGVDFQPVESQLQLNTIILNTDKSNINELNTNNKKDALTFDKGGMDASFPKEKEEGYVKLGNKKISKTKYTQSELESYLPNKLRELYLQENLIMDEDVEELVKIVMYFYKSYRICQKEKHPLLTDISYEKIVAGYLHPPEIMSDDEVFSFGKYKDMIDKYFAVDFGKYSGTPKNFNYRISHFMNNTIREHLYRQLESEI